MRKEISRFHPKCAKQGISHHSFADDLFLFSATDPYSIQILKDSLDEFGRCSGLWPNKEKSNIFFGNVSPGIKSLIQSILEFNVGSLPVRYLGVPLISTRLWVKDCKQRGFSLLLLCFCLFRSIGVLFSYFQSQ